MRRSLTLVSMLMLFGGCDAGSQRDRGVLCDPLADAEESISLGEVLAAGRDAEGVVYVLDRHADDELRAFVSEPGDILRRRRVTGEGEGRTGGVDFTQATLEGEPAFTLLFERADDGTQTFTKHAAGRVEPGATGGEPLTAVDDGDLELQFTLRNLPGEITVEYYGELVDARRVVVIRPTDDWTYEDFRVFLGTRERMDERAVRSVARQLDGGSTTIEIALDGERATLSFPVAFDGTDFMPGLWMLEQGGEMVPIVPFEEDSGRSELGLIYYCS